MTDTQIILLVMPILIIEIGLILFALRDLLRPERRVRGESKLMWGLLIVFVGLLGPILYLVVGRQEE
jgi:Phospholipase_D-nuclease N-terminal